MKARTGWVTIVLLTLGYAYLFAWSVLNGLVLAITIFTVFYIWLIRSVYKKAKSSN